MCGSESIRFLKDMEEIILPTARDNNGNPIGVVDYLTTQGAPDYKDWFTVDQGDTYATGTICHNKTVLAYRWKEQDKSAFVNQTYLYTYGPENDLYVKWQPTCNTPSFNVTKLFWVRTWGAVNGYSISKY